MVINKRKKNSRQRGSMTHGWGAMKKHRGKGNKGGAGMAGTGKRGDAKKPMIWKKDYFGKRGFSSKSSKKINAITLIDIEKILNKLLESKKITKEGESFIIDLGKLGYNKLLGNGQIKNKLNITVESASERAILKVKEKGGQISCGQEDKE